jgi:hypothetical protein
MSSSYVGFTPENLKSKLENLDGCWDKVKIENYEDNSGGLSQNYKMVRAIKKSDKSERPGGWKRVIRNVKRDLIYREKVIKQLETGTKFWSDYENNEWELIFYMSEKY